MLSHTILISQEKLVFFLYLKSTVGVRMGDLTVVVTGSLTAAAVAASSFGTYPNVMVGLNYQKNHDALVVHIQPLENFFTYYYIYKFQRKPSFILVLVHHQV